MIDRLGSWHYFCKPVSEGGSQDIYTAAEALIKKYRRPFVFLIVATFPIFYNLFIWLRYHLEQSSLNGTTLYMFFRILMFVIAGVALTALLRIANHIRRLRKQQQKAVYNQITKPRKGNSKSAIPVSAVAGTASAGARKQNEASPKPVLPSRR